MLKDLSQRLGMLKHRLKKCLEGYSLTESIFIPYEYLPSLEKSRVLTSQAGAEAESNGSNATKRKKGWP